VASQNDLIGLLYQAVATPLGMVLEVEDFVKATQALYRAKREAADPSLDLLQFRRSPYRPEAEVWIVKLTAAQAP